MTRGGVNVGGGVLLVEGEQRTGEGRECAQWRHEKWRVNGGRGG